MDLDGSLNRITGFTVLFFVNNKLIKHSSMNNSSIWQDICY